MSEPSQLGPGGSGNVEDEAPDELTGTVVRGAGFAGAGFILAQALTLAAYLVLARLLTPAEFGQFAAAALLVSVGLIFTESGMLAALIQRRDRIEEAASTAVVATALGGVAFAALALASAPLIGLIFDSSRIGALAAAVSGLLFLRALPVVPEALLQRRFSFLRRMVVEPAQVIAFGIAAIVAASNGMGPWAMVIGFYASAATDVLLSWILVRWRPKPSLVSFAMWRELISYGRHVLGSGLILRARDEVPTVLLGAFVGTAPLGQYKYAQRAASMPEGLLLSAAAYVVFPALARISDDAERFSAAFLRLLRAFAGLAVPAGFLLVAFGISIVVILFGEQWRPAGEATMALGFGAAAGSIAALASEALKACGRPDVLVPAHLISLATGAVAMLALLPFGLVGVSVGFTLGIAAGGVYEFIKLRSIVGLTLSELLRPVAPATAAGLAMIGAMLPIDRLLVDPPGLGGIAGLGALGVEILVALALYAGIVALISPTTLAEVRSTLARARRRGGGAAGLSPPSR